MFITAIKTSDLLIHIEVIPNALHNSIQDQLVIIIVKFTTQIVQSVQVYQVIACGPTACIHLIHLMITKYGTISSDQRSYRNEHLNRYRSTYRF